MKTVILFLLLFISQTAMSADIQIGSMSGNVSQQTGGNYIYAENGKLTFNFEQSMFQNRNWKYDASVDGAVTAFETNLPIKTKNSSSFHGYEVAANGEITLVAYYDENVPAPMLVKPVYRKGYEGRTVHVWLPQVAGWVVRVLGKVSRNVLPPIISKCLSNQMCKAQAIGIATWVCGFNFLWGSKDSPEGFLREVGFPKGVCEQAEKDGWQKDKDGQYVRNYKYRAYVKFGRRPDSDCKPEDYAICSPEFRELNIGADTVEDLVKQLQAMCSRQENIDYTNRDESSSGVGLSGKIVKAEFKEHTKNKEYLCSTTARDELGEFESPGASFTATIEDDVHKEKLTFIDLANYVSEDFKQDPNPYINDTGEVGKEIREKIQSSAAIMKKDGGTGTLNLTSEPYKNPNTGETMQDVLSINSGQSWEIPPNAGGTGSSGGGGSGGSGGNGSGSIPQGQNDVTVNSIPRPDLSGNAKPSENNSPNGTGTSVSVGIGGGGNTGGNGSGSGNNQGGTESGNSSGNTGGNQAASGVGQGGLKCDGEHKGTLACASLGEIKDGFFDDVEIPKKEDTTTWKPNYFLPDNGVCPQPKSFNFLGKPIYVSYEPICEFMRQIRFIILLGFTLLSAHIVFSTLRRK